KHHWHVYKEVGSEYEKLIRNMRQTKPVNHNDSTKRPNNRQGYLTKKHQQFYRYITKYDVSLTTRDIRDDNLKIILPQRQKMIKNKRIRIVHSQNQ
ncbi:unnamed protein product, partial [Didymodactylos carnosus]